MREALAFLTAALPTALLIANCSTEADVLLRIARDAAVDAETTIDTPARDIEAPDTRTILCGPGDACVVAAGEQCCADILALICVEAGTCEGGPIPCDQPGHCGAGQRCCGVPAAFLITTTCAPGPCPHYDLCARDADCEPGRTCQPGFGAYRFCE